MDDNKYVLRAIDLAKESVKQGGFPAGAVVVKDDVILGEGISVGNNINDPTAHGETTAIRNACQKIESSNLSGAVLYSNLEPCTMCFSVAYWSGISKIVFAAKKSESSIEKGYYEGKNESEQINNNNNRKIEMVYLSDLENESLSVVKEWENGRT